jgi:hypothetical protein
MKELLTAIESALHGLSGVRDADICITPDVNYLASWVRFPCIGIKDGPIEHIEMFGGQMGYTMYVDIVMYVQLQKPERGMTGDPSTGRIGILDLADSIHAILDENLLDISGMISTVVESEAASETFGDVDDLISRKIIRYKYEKEGDRP